MPRRKILHHPTTYRNHSINDKYNYDKQQLDKIIDALEYYSDQCTLDTRKDYVVFDVTLKVTDTSVSPYFDTTQYDDGSTPFNSNDLKTIFPSEYYFYRWTREWSKKSKEHYHVMVIVNTPAMTEYLKSIQQQISALNGVVNCYITPRLLPDDDHRKMIHFQWLKESNDDIDGLKDAVLRHCYKAKLDQKIDGVKRTFDGCRESKPLIPLSTYLYNMKKVA